MEQLAHFWHLATSNVTDLANGLMDGSWQPVNILILILAVAALVELDRLRFYRGERPQPAAPRRSARIAVIALEGSISAISVAAMFCSGIGLAHAHLG